MADGITIEALSPARAADLFAFFEGPAFADNRGWGGCYCHFCYFDHAAARWDPDRGEANKAASARLITRGVMKGHLAYADGQVVGWVNAAPSASFPPDNIGGPDPEQDHIGQVLCFVVAPAWRRRGVARGLLDAACAGLKAQGMTIVQANPRPDAEGDGANHHGPLGLYLGEDFTQHRRDEADGSVFVRRTL
jgi:GNAT superfamily N-acetyltransferase